jgi:hypothetical protein
MNKHHKVPSINSSVIETTSQVISAQADPILGEQAIHWVLCKESYATNRRKEIDGWSLVGETPASCMYHLEDRAIIAFRGTKVLMDLFTDIQLTVGPPCGFDRVGPAKEMVDEFLKENPGVEIQVTGHSLGGAIARCVGQALQLGIVTFNEAAPPQNPVITGPNEKDYHIVLDVFSAWQNPNVIRIDRGYRLPARNWFGHTNLASVALATAKAHSLSNFAAARGTVVDSAFETKLFDDWYKYLPLTQKATLWTFGLGRLPPVGT